MRDQIVAGNWKMNLSPDEAVALIEGIGDAESGVPIDVSLIVCPPFPYLHQVKNSMDVTSRVNLGAQDVAAYNNGAYTGEVSASMLRELRVEYVILGHSERRKYFGEDNAILTEKLERLREHGLTPIFCVGETFEERKSGDFLAVIEEQLQPILTFAKAYADYKFILAYEPVWAIGTGEVATPKQAQDVHAHIRNVMNDMLDGRGEQVSILYGGSCKPDNAADLFSCVDIDGGLIGGAALKPTDFIKIAKQF